MSFRGLRPHQASPWTHWGPHGGPQTPCHFKHALRFWSSYATNILIVFQINQFNYQPVLNCIVLFIC